MSARERADVALYGHWICPFVTRVQFALAYRGIDHELVDLPPSALRSADFVLPPEFVEHSPRLEIPMVRVGDAYLADSIPILEWLEAAFDHAPLLPTDEVQRRLVRERMTWVDEHAFRAMIGVYYGTDPDRVRRASARLTEAMAMMGGWADGGGWLAGDTPTLAEAVAMPIHVRLTALQRLGFVDEVPPAFVAHGERCRELPGWAMVAWSAAQTDEVVGRFTTYRARAHQ